MNDNIQEDDYVIRDCGKLGCKTSVSCDGKTKIFNSFDEAIAFINEDMQEQNFYPNIFQISDHGNVNQLDDEGNILE